MCGIAGFVDFGGRPLAQLETALRIEKVTHGALPAEMWRRG